MACLELVGNVDSCVTDDLLQRGRDGAGNRGILCGLLHCSREAATALGIVAYGEVYGIVVVPRHRRHGCFEVEVVSVNATLVLLKTPSHTWPFVARLVLGKKAPHGI